MHGTILMASENDCSVAPATEGCRLTRRCRSSGHGPLCRLLLCLLLVCGAGCVSEEVDRDGILTAYQESIAAAGPQRVIEVQGDKSTDPLDVLKPYASPEREVLPLPAEVDPATGKRVIRLSLGHAIVRALDNNPGIRVVSFDPEIAKQQVRQAAGEFDPTAFARANYEEQDNPINSIFQPGQSESRLFESGLKQRLTTGTEWSAAYALAREWDDLFGRPLPKRYEPFVTFELRQPLLRDAWSGVNLAGVDVAKQNYRLAMLDFRRQTDETTTEVVAAYWRLWQADRDLRIFQELFDQTTETLRKIEGRVGIDATDIQLKQAETSLMVRDAALVRARTRVRDARDNLLALTADPQLNLLADVEIVPTTTPMGQTEELDVPAILRAAMLNNPRVEQARVALDIADLNVRMADNQRMPRLDLVGSTRTQGLAEDLDDAHDPLGRGQFLSYAVGLSLEVPLDNRQREAALEQRRIERRRAMASLADVADDVALFAKARIRRMETSATEIVIHKKTENAARSHLEAMERAEDARQQLTPEFLLVKLQAQESLAGARRDLAEATVEFNVALAELAQTMGSVLELYGIRPVADLDAP